MKYRRRTSDGDMLPVTRSSHLLNGTDAVKEAIDSSLHLLRNEWWENTSVGFYVPSLLYEGVRTTEGKQMLASYIASFISEVEGVNAITDAGFVMENRVLKFQVTVTTDFGTATERVSESVLYSAIS